MMPRTAQQKMPVILIVEDDPQNRELLATVLRPAGYTIIKASDGRDGIAKAIQNPPDVVLMDIRLPDISGIEAARRIRESLPERTIRIIAVTASIMPEDEDAIVEGGIDAVVRKPVEIAELRREVARWLDDGAGPS